MDDERHRSILQIIKRRSMLHRALLPDYSSKALAEPIRIKSPAPIEVEQVHDLNAASKSK